MNIIIVSIVSLTVNVILGKYRAKFQKMTFIWWFMIHASIPLIIPLRTMLDTPITVIPLFIGLAVIGQIIGSRFLAAYDNKPK